MDIEELQLNQFKRLADGEAYFHLFKNHLTGIKACMNVLLYKIENIDCIAKIIDSCSNAHFIVTGDESISNALKLVLSKTINVDYSKNFDLKKNNMKFDFIVMNPPWGGSLQLDLDTEYLEKHSTMSLTKER